MMVHCRSSVSYTHLDVYKRQGVAAVFTITTNISSIHNNLFTNEHLLEEYYDANYFTCLLYTSHSMQAAMRRALLRRGRSGNTAVSKTESNVAGNRCV